MNSSRSSNIDDEPRRNKKVVVVGGGFAGLAVIHQLAGRKGIDVCLIDRRNHHLFQPLLYQVAMAGLNPSDIAIPFRRLFSQKNVKIIMAEVEDVDLDEKKLLVENSPVEFDYLVLACGSKHFYFGNNEWEEFAPGLKTIEQATEIRRRILLAFELAEKESDQSKIRKLITFAIVGGGPTGVELAGAIAEMAIHTIYKDYKNVDLKKTRVLLIEAGPRILSAFPEELSAQAAKDLQKLGVEVVTNRLASDLGPNGLKVGDEFIESQTIIWAAGIRPSKLSEKVVGPKSNDGRVVVNDDMSVEGKPFAFVLGDQAAFPVGEEGEQEYLPALAPVAIQQGQFVGKLIRNELAGKKRSKFVYFDKGIMATVGRSKAIVSSGALRLSGFVAWVMWAVIHIGYLVQFKSKVFVLLQWTWSYFSFGKGARLIVHKTWKFYSGEKIPITDENKSTDENRKK